MKNTPTIDAIDVETPTVSVKDYLASKNGKKAIRLFRKHIKELGKTPCRKHGFTYVLAYKLDYALTQRLPSSVFHDFDLKAGIMDADPKEVEKDWENWEFSDYAGNILGSDTDEYYAEVKAAFYDWLPEDEKDW